MGSFSILNNISGINAQNQLNLNNVNLSRTLLRMSSGKRVNTGADDAAGLQIADSLRANVKALDQAVRNANDGISVAQIADGALNEIGNLLTRAVTLAEEAATGTVDSAGRTALNDEFTKIKAEIGRIAQNTDFNGKTLIENATGLNGSLNIFVGDSQLNTSIAVTFGFVTVASGSATVFSTLGASPATADLTSSSLSGTDGLSAKTALINIKSALSVVSSMRGSIGAGINRLQSSVAVMMAQSQNTQAAESTIRDANMAEEVANLTKYQILAQSGISSLAQANQNAQIVLGLIRG
jgi:flagellin